MNSDISMILHILQSHNAGRGYHGDGATTPMSDHPPPNYSHVNSPSDSEEKFSHSQSLHRQDRVVSDSTLLDSHLSEFNLTFAIYCKHVLDKYLQVSQPSSYESVFFAPCAK